MQYGRSIECCKEALSIKTAMADQPGKYQCYLAFGKTYNNLGHYRKAIHYANRSLKMGEELEFGDGAPLSIIGNALYYQGLFEESIEYFTKDLQLYVRQPEIIAAKETATRTLILHISHWGRLKNQSSIVKGHSKS